MRNCAVVALLFVSLLVTAGTTMAGGKNDGEDIVKTLLSRTDSLQKEISHLQVIVTAVLKKDSVCEDVRETLIGFSQQLNVMGPAVKSLKKEIKSDSVRPANDPSLRRERSVTSKLLADIEEALQEMRRSLQEDNNLYTI